MTGESDESKTTRTAMVWIEDATGGASRGFADAMSPRDLHVHLADAPPFRPGDLVALRVCVRRDAPIVPARARVSAVHDEGGAFSCVLEWVPSAAVRGAVEAWLAPAA